MSSSIQTIIRETSQALHNASDDKKAKIVGQLSLVLEDVFGKLSEFNDIPEHFNTNVEPQMTAQIKAIDERTEHAADAILGACEKMSAAIKNAPEDIKKAVQTQINAIFEASNFQDLVSQHANEIRLLLEDIKSDMQDIHALTSGGEGSSAGGLKQRSRDKNKRADSHLLNGPAVQVNKK